MERIVENGKGRSIIDWRIKIKKFMNLNKNYVFKEIYLSCGLELLKTSENYLRDIHIIEFIKMDMSISNKVNLEFQPEILKI
jgi:hypothetical protein